MEEKPTHLAPSCKAQAAGRNKRANSPALGAQSSVVEKLGRKGLDLKCDLEILTTSQVTCHQAGKLGLDSSIESVGLCFRRLQALSVDVEPKVLDRPLALEPRESCELPIRKALSSHPCLLLSSPRRINCAHPMSIAGLASLEMRRVLQGANDATPP